MTNRVTWKVTILVGDGPAKDYTIEGYSEDSVLETAAKIAERMGGSFLDIVSFRLVDTEQEG